MERDVRWLHTIKVGLSLALAGAALVVSSCGDDDDAPNSGDDAGATGRDAGGDSGRGGTGSSGRGGTGGSSGRGGTGGSSGRGGAGGDEGGSGGTAGTDEDAGPEAPAFRSVTVEMTGVDPHIGQMMQFRVVSAADELIALGVLDPLEAAEATFELPGSTPAGDHRMDFFADVNGNGNFNMPPADHAWRIAIPDGDDVVLEFAHNTDFTDIDAPPVTEGRDFTFMAEAMDPHVGQRFELRLIEQDSGRLVGRYVLAAIGAAAFSVELPGIIQQGTAYRIDSSADMNDDGAYDAPPVDHAWRQEVESDNNALTVLFTHNTTFTDVEF